MTAEESDLDDLLEIARVKPPYDIAAGQAASVRVVALRCGGPSDLLARIEASAVLAA